MITSVEWLTQGYQRQQEGDFAQAERIYRQVVQADPAQSEAWRLLADLHTCQQRLVESIPLYQQAARLAPGVAVTHHSLGNAFSRLGRLLDAEQSYRQAIVCRPDYALAHNSLGIVLGQQRRHDDAIASYREAVRVQPKYAEAFMNLANVYKGQGRLDEAIACYRRAVELHPGGPIMHSNLLYAMAFHPACTPEAIFQEHLLWARRHAVAPRLPLPPSSEPVGERRLRIGYYSADFRRHVMGYFLEAVLGTLDRKRFEVFCYANVNRPDDLTQRVRNLADGWRSVRNLSDDQAAEMIRQDRIDILVDLVGHTGGTRLGIFVRKPSPIQVSHFGYQATTGVPAIDYRITDAFSDPPGMTERYHTEELFRLPELLWCYPPPESPAVSPLPARQNGHVTFGSLNGLAKVTEQVVGTWARILARVPDSRIAVQTGVGRQADQRILNAFAAHGVSAERVTLLGKARRQGYFELFHGIDIALDPFPCVGCNTTADSLWMGVPVVSLAGPTCFHRQSVGPLTLVGLKELVVETTDAYVEAAVKLAGDVQRLAELRGILRERMRRSPLTDVQRFTRQLEEGYRTMWQRHVGASQTPEAIRETA